MKRCGGVEIKFYAFWTSALDGVEWPASSLSRFIPREKPPVAIICEGWCPQSRSGCCSEETSLVYLSEETFIATTPQCYCSQY
jgi:hypothetical protein